MPNWAKANQELVRVILREGETYLQGQLTIATSADQRASVLGGIFAASGTATLAGMIAAVAGGGAVPLAVIVAAIVSGALFLIGSGLCLSTAFPVDFYLPGNEPANWYSDIDGETELTKALGNEAENFQEKIADNDRVIAGNARFFRIGASVGIAAPFVGLAIWLASLLG